MWRASFSEFILVGYEGTGYISGNFMGDLKSLPELDTLSDFVLICLDLCTPETKLFNKDFLFW